MTNGGGDDSQLSSLVERAIAALRIKLLDLSLRNRLINFKFSETSKKFVRVVDELPDELFSRLTDESPDPRKLYFQPLPEPDDAVDPAESTHEFALALEEARLTDTDYRQAVASGNGNGAGEEQIEAALRKKVRTALGLGDGSKGRRAVNLASWAGENGINPSYDLPLPGGHDNPAHRDNKIQTLHLPDALERKTSALREDARIAEQELGLSTLHAAFGYLEWMESTESDISLFAPLILLPVQIDREIKGSRYRYFIQSGAGQDPVINLTLKERLQTDFNLKLPDLDEDDTPETYFKKVARAVSGQKRWKVRRFVVIGHFSFARLAMYEDLDPNRWGDSPPHEQELVSNILAGSARSNGESIADEYDIDDPEVESAVPLLITDADSSQFSALVDAMRGRSFALKGPPGTGKSQTITNLIAAALASGKSVLFVAEKMAALDVVSKRLKDAGLGPFLLELHSTKAQKKQVLESFEERLSISRSGSTRAAHKLESTIAQLKRTRDELKHYVHRLNSTVGDSETTLHDAFWLEQSARRGVSDEILGRLANLKIGNAHAVNVARATERGQLIREYAQLRERVVRLKGSVEDHPLHGANKPRGSQFDVQAMSADLVSLQLANDQCLAVLDHLDSAFSGSAPRHLGEIRPLAEALSALPDISPAVDIGVLEGLKRRASLDELRLAAEMLDELLVARDQIARVYNHPDRVLDELDSAKANTAAAVAAVKAVGKANVTLADAGDLLSGELGQTELAMQALAQFGRFRDLLGLPAEVDTRPGVIALLDAAELIRGASTECLQHRHSALAESDAVEQLSQLAIEVHTCRNELRRLSKTSQLDRCPSGRQLSVTASSIEATNPVVYLIGSQGRSARKLFREIANRKAKSRSELVERFRELAGALEKKEQIAANAVLRKFAGTWAAGVESPVDELLRIPRHVGPRFHVMSGQDSTACRATVPRQAGPAEG